MCVTSMIGDHYRDKWTSPQWPRNPFDNGTGGTDTSVVIVPQLPSPISREEFDQLKRDVLEMKALLKRAKEYDERNNEPECEVDEKMDLLRKVAKLVGIDLDDVIGPKPSAA